MPPYEAHWACVVTMHGGTPGRFTQHAPVGAGCAKAVALTIDVTSAAVANRSPVRVQWAQSKRLANVPAKRADIELCMSDSSSTGEQQGNRKRFSTRSTLHGPQHRTDSVFRDVQAVWRTAHWL